MRRTLLLCAPVVLMLALSGAAHAIHIAVYTETTQWIGQVLAQQEADIFMDAMDENGNTVNWGFENGGVSALAILGYHRNSVRVGEEITAIVHPAANGAPTAVVVKVILADGTEMMCRDGGIASCD